MACYVDTPYRAGNKPGWCHLVTDGDIAELHEFAAALGLKRSYFQPLPPHYDISASKRAMAITRGAIEVKRKQLASIVSQATALRLKEVADD